HPATRRRLDPSPHALPKRRGGPTRSCGTSRRDGSALCPAIHRPSQESAGAADFFSWAASGMARNARNRKAALSPWKSAFIIGWWCGVEIMIMRPPVKPLRQFAQKVALVPIVPYLPYLPSVPAARPGNAQTYGTLAAPFALLNRATTVTF